MIQRILILSRYVLFVTLSLFFWSCKSNLANQPNQKRSAIASYEFLSLEEGQKRICRDEREGFFDKIANLDMRLQMGIDNNSENSLLKKEYKAHLKKSILNFKAEEKVVLSATMDSCFKMIYSLFPNLALPTIQLIKTDANHYGPSVYYTRENTIIIPENELRNAGIGNLQAVMLHEISHILFRYNESLKTQAYALIGFKKLNKEIYYPESLKRKMLLNPDGLDNRFFIDLNLKGNAMKVVPIIVSSKKEYTPNILGFMNYIKFDLYHMIEKNGILEVVCTDNGFSKLGAEYMGPFFEQIKENTQYIIHPDEIIADNFMMLLIGDRDGTLGNFSDEGQKLLSDLKKILSI